jgi:mono/diheme cytochrome c family protein
MNRQCLGIRPAVGLLLLFSGCALTNSHQQAQYFETEIAPLLRRHCIKCHGIEEREAGLDLRTLRGVLRGGQGGPAIVWGRPEKSLLLRMVLKEEMPPKGPPLKANEIDLLRRWIWREVPGH